MRVAIAGLHTETNTFSPGHDIVGAYADSHHTIAGFLAGCREAQADVVPLMYANAMACGMLSAEAFESVADEIVRALAEQGPFDVVLLAGHGAAVSEEHVDPEGELASRVRAVVGDGVTISVGLDLHGNITQRLIGAVDVAVGYRENAHRDPAVRGRECASLALRAARGEIRPVQRLVRLPMVVLILGGWTGAMRMVMEEAETIADAHGLLSHAVFHGFGYADVPQLGSSVVAVADGDEIAAAHAAREIADRLWCHRDGLLGAALAPAAAIAEAERRSCDGGPVVVLDVGDNVGGGATGDSTVLLAEAVERGVHGFVATLCDGHAVRDAEAAGVGAEIGLRVGRTTPVSVGPEVLVRGRVAQLMDGRFEDPNVSHGGFRFWDGGPTVRMTTAGEQEIVISSRAVPAFSAEQLRAAGIEPREQRVVVAKGVVAPRAGYGPIASDFLLADTPGVTAANLSTFDYRRRPRPLWPLDA